MNLSITSHERVTGKIHPDLQFFCVCFSHPREVDLFIPEIESYGNFQMVPSHGKGRKQ